MDLLSRLEQYRLEEKALAWRGTFADYFELVRANPSVTQLAHARVHSMIADAGGTTDDKGRPIYHFFDGEIYVWRRPSSRSWNTSDRLGSAWRSASASSC
jgi:serine protein kinase